MNTGRGLRPRGSPSEGEKERRKVGWKSLTCVLRKFSSANGKYSKLQSLPRERSVFQKYSCLGISVMLGHWLAAAHGKGGLVIL